MLGITPAPSRAVLVTAVAAGALALTGCAKTAEERAEVFEDCAKPTGYETLALDYTIGGARTVVEITKGKSDDKLAIATVFEDAESAKLAFDYEEDEDRPLTFKGPVVLEAPMDLPRRGELVRCATRAAEA